MTDDYPLACCAHGWPIGYCAECRAQRMAEAERLLRWVHDAGYYRGEIAAFLGYESGKEGVKSE